MTELINKGDAIKVALDFFVEFQGGAFHIEEQKELEKRLRDIQSPLPTEHGALYDYEHLSSLVGEDFAKFMSRLDLKLPKPIIEAE